MPVVDSRITTVTLYQQGARVTRTLSVSAVDGKLPPEIEIAPLPLALFDPAVRLRVTSIDGSAEVLATNVRVGLHVPPRDAPMLSVDEKRLQEVTREIALKSETLQGLRDEQTLLRNIPIPERPEAEDGKPPPPSPMAARVALEEFAQAGIHARLKEVEALEEALRRLEEERASIQQQLQLASNARALRPQDISKSVIASLQVRGGPVSRVEMSLEYLVPGARWAPAYQFRMTRDCRQAELVMRALVCQRSGEDWKGVKLVLSTAAPMSWTELPELSAIRIGRAQPVPPAKAGFRPPPTGAGPLFQDYDRDRSRFSAASLLPAAFQAPVLDEIIEEIPAPAPSRPKRARRKEEMARAITLSAVEEESAGAELDDAPMMELGSAAPPPPPFPPSMAPPAGGAVFAAPMPAPAPAMKSAAPMMKAARMSTGAAKGDAGPSQSAMEMVVFSSLRLSSPDDASNRNRLTPVDTRRAYLESIQRFNVTVSIDVMQVVRQAERDAGSAVNTPMPPGALDVKHASGNFDFSYATEATVDVPSDGLFHSVPVGTRTADASVLYVAVPREDSNVYRQAMVKNPLNSPLLGGPAEVYVVGDYVLGTSLPTVAPKGELKLGLGVEQSIKVARNTTFKEVRTGTKVVATSELIHTILIDVVNNLEREIDCEVRERIPQPARNAEVVVEEAAVTPAWQAYAQEERSSPIEGGRRWRIKVPANAKQALKAEYVVKLYANNELVGGNRREI